MLKSFVEYIFESDSKLKLKLYFSKRFREFIYKIEKSSNDASIKSLASSIRNSEKSNTFYSDMTLIDMTDKNDMISFIQVNRIKRKWDDPKSDPSPENFDDIEEWIDYITNFPENSLWKEQRGEVKIGKFVKKVFKDNNFEISDSSIEKFTNFYKSTYDFENNIEGRLEIVSGEDIRKWYLESNYSEKRGQLGNSCMRYERCQSFLDIYVNNPDVCKLLVIYSTPDKDKISGRAILWTNIDSDILLDRVYTVSDSDINVIKKYAESKGWIDITTKRKITKIQLKNKVYSEYPYMDTFYIFNYDKFYLTNDYNIWPEKGFYKLQNTDGGYLSDEGVWSEYHGEYIDREEAVYCSNVNDWVYTDSAIYLEYKDIWASPDEETVWSEWYSQSYYLDDTVHSEIMSDYLLAEDTISIRVNYYGDEDYIAQDYLDKSLITVYDESDEIKTLPQFVVLDPTTGRYHFKDETVDGESILKVISDKLSKVEVDTTKIKDYLINLDIEIVKNKFDEQRIQYGVYLPSVSFFSRKNSITNLIKYLLYAYPDKANQRDGLPKLVSGVILSNTERYSRFRNSIINFDEDFLKKLCGEESYETLKSMPQDSLFSLSKISQSFIGDIFKDEETYKMWYKWKMT